MHLSVDSVRKLRNHCVRCLFNFNYSLHQRSPRLVSSKDPSCLSVKLDKSGNENSWIFIQPHLKHRSTGAFVEVGDQLFICFKTQAEVRIVMELMWSVLGASARGLAILFSLFVLAFACVFFFSFCVLLGIYAFTFVFIVRVN